MKQANAKLILGGEVVSASADMLSEYCEQQIDLRVGQANANLILCYEVPSTSADMLSEYHEQ